jgi:hypothetical protein
LGLFFGAGQARGRGTPLAPYLPVQPIPLREVPLPRKRFFFVFLIPFAVGCASTPSIDTADEPISCEGTLAKDRKLSSLRQCYPGPLGVGYRKDPVAALDFLLAALPQTEGSRRETALTLLEEHTVEIGEQRHLSLESEDGRKLLIRYDSGSPETIAADLEKAKLELGVASDLRWALSQSVPAGAIPIFGLGSFRVLDHGEMAVEAEQAARRRPKAR